MHTVVPSAVVAVVACVVAASEGLPLAVVTVSAVLAVAAILAGILATKKVCAAVE